MPAALRLSLPSPDATATLARSLAPALHAGDVLLLEGEIGAGKTHFARSLIQHLQGDRAEDVPSPTFTLVQTYETPGLEVWHADLYRLSHPDEVLELGLDEAFRSALCLVEWPDRLGPLAPPQALTLTFAVSGEQGRVLTVSGDPSRLARFQKAADPADAVAR
ncbi:tRNA (adenosine(37)-N6)-threonylcarbamoyltransferase complex ATPase subunit type 1 TsaE [Oceaniglobus roseus]|uniref:tRNA (adenosine(37)-N6)-threonylcarbamoyltransferase complex ATPase subunit type 1 TsaE n=1 Tax=Oceaniglobus roseus TaxID=1737570 RepID=UPI000C7F660C|nr:tRNA (adenosine(37)-N6)-threonylcarbamoyltransferase complex ATPase subunit type 1 TsaE [Kandeliimicrobium roseum]